MSELSEQLHVEVLPAKETPCLALFDFDGTITTHETMPAFLRRSVSRGRLVFGYIVLAPLIVGYKLRLVSGTWVRRAIVRVGYSGVPAADVDAAGKAFAATYLPTVLRPHAMQRIAWHQAQGHTVVIVSGGLDVYLAPWCGQHGLALVCSSLEAHAGALTGRYAGRQCVLAEKARRVCEQYDLNAYAAIHAYGDTPEDGDMLGLATRRYYQWQEI